MKEIEVKIAEFVKSPNLKTRCGVPHEVNGFQRDGNGNVSALVGFVTITKKEGEEPKPQEILWTTNGNGMNCPPMIYDLVEHLSIEELGK